MKALEHLQQRFLAAYGEPPAFVVRAPGRVNLIGEHTDYNDGFVLPLAIDRAAYIALRPRNDTVVCVHSLNMDEQGSFALDALQRPSAVTWIDYLVGVAWALQARGYALSGWQGLLWGDVPIGAALSSSAALELATARAFHCVAGFTWEAAAMARACQAAENEWLGIQTGIMDQMISAAGVEGQALLIDCRSLETATAALPPHTVLVILDTSTRRGLVDSAYNQRRAQCEAVAQHFGVAALRDLNSVSFERRAAELPPLLQRRARHVISENERTLQARAAMLAGDADTLGALMDASHRSLRDDFEVSSAALNTMVDCARAEPACYGARMTGGGFGGCAVALVRAEAAPAFVARVASTYQAATSRQPTLTITRARGGANTVYPPPSTLNAAPRR